MVVCVVHCSWAIDHICQQGIVQTNSGSIIVWNVFTWHKSSLLVCLNMSLTSNSDSALLCDHLHLFMNFMYLNNDGKMHFVIRVKLRRYGLRSILKTSNKWHGYYIYLTWVQLHIYGTWLRGLLVYKFQYLHIAEVLRNSISPEVFQPLFESMLC